MDSSIIYRFLFVLFIFTTSQVKAIEFQGKFIQGHFILGKTNPDSKFLVGKKEVKVSKDGFFVFGIDRDRKFDLTFTKIENNKKTKIIKKVLKRKYNIQRIDGLAESKVTPPESVYKRIKTYTFSKVQTARKDMDKLTGCSKLFLLKFIESKFYDHPITNEKMTWANSNEWHIDHITPLKALNPKNEEHFKIANHFSNLQPMWADENLRKGANVTPGYGVAHLKRKYKTLQSLEDLIISSGNCGNLFLIPIL